MPGAADLPTLRHYVTPEILSYFSEQLAQNNSAGVENHVDDVELVNGDVREAWSEGNFLNTRRCSSTPGGRAIGRCGPTRTGRAGLAGRG